MVPIFERICYLKHHCLPIFIILSFESFTFFFFFFHWHYSPLWALACRFLSTFVTISFFFLLGGIFSPTPNPQPGGPGYPFLSGSSPLTCLALEALPVAYATASIALRIMWPHKPHHYVKVGIPSGGMLSGTLWITSLLFYSVAKPITPHGHQEAFSWSSHKWRPRGRVAV